MAGLPKRMSRISKPKERRVADSKHEIVSKQNVIFVLRLAKKIILLGNKELNNAMIVLLMIYNLLSCFNVLVLLTSCFVR